MRSRRTCFYLRAPLALLAIALALPLPIHAQGCSLCRDTTAGSAPRAQQSLRRAILILGIPAGGIFTGILVLARKIKPSEDIPEQLQPDLSRASVKPNVGSE